MQTACKAHHVLRYAVLCTSLVSMSRSVCDPCACVGCVRRLFFACSLLEQDPDNWALQAVRDHAITCIHATASTHLATWTRLANKHPFLLALLVQQAAELAAVNSPCAVPASKLVQLALTPAPATAAAGAAPAGTAVLGLPVLGHADAAAAQPAILASLVARFVCACLVYCPDAHVRRNAQAAVKGLWDQYGQMAREQLLWLLSSMLNETVYVGSSARHLWVRHTHTPPHTHTHACLCSKHSTHHPQLHG